MKTLNDYMAMSYRMEIIEDKDEGGFVVSYPDLPGCITCGETVESAVENALDAKKALIEPMSLDEKLEFFQMLVDIGFKEIEVGFPAASETEFIFMRTLIERDMIPDDVTVQVLTQAREHIIKKTFEAVKGAPHAVIHQ